MENTSFAQQNAVFVDTHPTSEPFLGSKLSYYIGTVFAVFLFWLVQSSPSGAEGIPMYKTAKWRWLFGAERLLVDSYRKFKDQVYQIDGTEGSQVLLPLKYVKEVKLLPDDTLSNTLAINDSLQTQYTGFPICNENREKLITLLRSRLSPGVVEHVPLMKEELTHLVDSEFPSCSDWTSVTWQPFGLRAVSRMSGSIFVGPAVSRGEAWTRTSIDFAVTVFIAGAKLQLFPQWARPWGQYLVSELRKIRRSILSSAGDLKPLLDKKREERKQNGVPAPNKRDLLDWVIEELSEEDRWDAETQAELQLMLAAASIHTTGGLLGDCMYDLANDQDLQEELRKEAHEVLECDNGWEKKESMGRLRKLDSFIREVQRHHGNIASVFRKAVKPVTLSDGTYLAPGTSIFSPLVALSMDDQYYTNAETFDPMRFYRARETAKQESEANQWKLTTTSDLNTHFGIGRHTCPGRFLADNEIKLVLSYFLINYDVRLQPGEKRPKSVTIVMTKGPNPTVKLQFRKRNTA